jgi:putative serine protease PepD
MATALSVADQLEQDGGAAVSTPAPAQQRALLGVQVQDGAGSGAEVIGVEAGGPAAAAGIRAGDTIVGFDGASIDSTQALGSAIQAHEPGDRVEVEWIDPAGRQQSATVTLAAA